MTLSGLALAVGILVDQATVSIENIHQHLEMKKSRAQAIWDACKEIAFPEFLILLCILAVFAPALVMNGVPKSMFLPLSLAVGFAMIASFLLAQTLVPVLASWLLKENQHHEATLALDEAEQTTLIEESKHPESQGGFNKFKLRYLEWLEKIFQRIGFWTTVYLVVHS